MGCASRGGQSSSMSPCVFFFRLLCAQTKADSHTCEQPARTQLYQWNEPITNSTSREGESESDRESQGEGEGEISCVAKWVGV
uniref:Putative secreted protein n=1 Tax=Anopheles triannulatus TaxID=58253 RepID=A0A2M4B709_9DIPT